MTLWCGVVVWCCVDMNVTAPPKVLVAEDRIRHMTESQRVLCEAVSRLVTERGALYRELQTAVQQLQAKRMSEEQHLTARITQLLQGMREQSQAAALHHTLHAEAHAKAFGDAQAQAQAHTQALEQARAQAEAERSLLHTHTQDAAHAQLQALLQSLTAAAPSTSQLPPAFELPAAPPPASDVPPVLPHPFHRSILFPDAPPLPSAAPVTAPTASAVFLKPAAASEVQAPSAPQTSETEVKSAVLVDAPSTSTAPAPTATATAPSVTPTPAAAAALPADPAAEASAVTSAPPAPAQSAAPDGAAASTDREPTPDTAPAAALQPPSSSVPSQPRDPSQQQL